MWETDRKKLDNPFSHGSLSHHANQLLNILSFNPIQIKIMELDDTNASTGSKGWKPIHMGNLLLSASRHSRRRQLPCPVHEPPQTQSTSWLPVAGVLLVCLPWLFWLLTILYRLISRTCGFRMGGSYGGNGVRGGGGSVSGASGGGGVGSVKNAAADEASETVAASSPVNSPERSGARRVHFGAAVVVGEQDGQGELEKKNENQIRSLSSSNSSNDISINSHESEIPLALSMVS
ncbi:hypothetical protein CK203_077379 [Vitis vinifera]|uniref:Uncharacterized protein n=1 Tax=Vitis vinifera TaxID=29760 RepID=A0A438D231_VITVI|nr:hypothetical protein CK203_077379 [Vitis vinifera]